MATEYRSDEQIQQDVLEELRWEARARPSGIGVMVCDGVVTLSGQVDRYSKKWAAKEAALRVRDSKAIADEVEVRLPSTAAGPTPISPTRRCGRSSGRSTTASPSAHRTQREPRAWQDRPR